MPPPRRLDADTRGKWISAEEGLDLGGLVTLVKKRESDGSWAGVQLGLSSASTDGWGVRGTYGTCNESCVCVCVCVCVAKLCMHNIAR